MTTKKQRQDVFDKSNGKCWYCGCNLPERGWHLDHLIPVKRSYCDMWDGVKSKVRREVTLKHPELDVFENWVPSCKACNMLKGNLTIEEFRERIEDMTDQAIRYSNHFRHALRYGFVEIKREPFVFWFEKG